MRVLRFLANYKNRVAVAFYLSCASLLGFFRRFGTSAGHWRSLVIPPVSHPGSLGDEAMVGALIGELRAGESEILGILSSVMAPDWNVESTVRSESVGQVGVITYFDLTMFRYLRILSRYDEVYLLGADVLDGGQGDGAEHLLLKVIMAYRAGLRATIVGASCNESPTPKMRRAWRRLPAAVKVCARDPLSAERLQSLARRQICRSADIAFLLPPVARSTILAEFYDWSAMWSEKEIPILAVNVSSEVSRRLRRELEDLTTCNQRFVDYLGAGIRLVSELRSVAVVLIPHDRRKPCSDVGITQMLAQQLAPTFPGRLFVVPGEVKAGEAKAIVGSVQLVLSGRMHLAVASLGMGTPALGFGYQGKFEGMFLNFGLEGFCIPREEISDGDFVALSARIVEKLDGADDLRVSILNRLPFVVGLAKRNLPDTDQTGKIHE